MRAIDISIGKEIYAACEHFGLAMVACRVQNSAYSEELWNEIEAFSEDFRKNVPMEAINKRVPIEATRRAYKNLGKDPNRYRPSAEALCRRIVKGMELYRINTLVDVINLVSLKTGYSIGGFDAERIEGDVCLGVGRSGERFEGIGRGLLNIEGLPVYRDHAGGIGTPTSDEERTKLAVSTTHLLMLINGYSGSEGLGEAAAYAVERLKKYAGAEDITVKYL